MGRQNWLAQPHGILTYARQHRMASGWLVGSEVTTKSFCVCKRTSVYAWCQLNTQTIPGFSYASDRKLVCESRNTCVTWPLAKARRCGLNHTGSDCSQFGFDFQEDMCWLISSSPVHMNSKMLTGTSANNFGTNWLLCSRSYLPIAGDKFDILSLLYILQATMETGNKDTEGDPAYTTWSRNDTVYCPHGEQRDRSCPPFHWLTCL